MEIIFIIILSIITLDIIIILYMRKTHRILMDYDSYKSYLRDRCGCEEIEILIERNWEDKKLILFYDHRGGGLLIIKAVKNKQGVVDDIIFSESFINKKVLLANGMKVICFFGINEDMICKTLVGSVDSENINISISDEVEILKLWPIDSEKIYEDINNFKVIGKNGEEITIRLQQEYYNKFYNIINS